MRLPVSIAVRRAARRLQRQFAPCAVILMYHRVARVCSDPWRLCVSPEHFTEHLEVVRKMTRPVALPHLMQSMEARMAPRRAVAITFDDGYADNLYNARPLLDRFDVPATVFLATGHLGSEEEFWWDELERILLLPGALPPELALDAGGCRYRWELGDVDAYSPAEFERHRAWIAWGQDPPTPRQAVFSSLYELLQPLPSPEQRRIMDTLRAWSGGGRQCRPECRTVRPDEALALDRGGRVEIGAHTVNHPLLSSLSVAEQANEVQGSKRALEQLLGHPVRSFAYPFGRRSDYTAGTVSVVREAGFACACSNFAGVVERGTDRFQLPRVHVRDWNGEEFSRKLASWMEGAVE